MSLDYLNNQTIQNNQMYLFIVLTTLCFHDSMFFTFADEHQIKNKNKLLLVLALKSGSGSISALLLLPVNL